LLVVSVNLVYLTPPLLQQIYLRLTRRDFPQARIVFPWSEVWGKVIEMIVDSFPIVSLGSLVEVRTLRANKQ